MAEIRTYSLLKQFILGFIISVLLLETLFRIYYFLGERKLLGLSPARTTLIWVDDEKVGRKLAPNQRGLFVSPRKEYITSIETNSEGFRDVEHRIEKGEGKKRVIILGDSFVENFQVSLQKTFFRQLAENLKEENVEIIALGLGNTGSAQEYFLLREWGLKYKPDVVVQLFLTANDVRNNLEELNKISYLPYLEIDSSGKVTEIKPVRQTSISTKIKEVLKNLRFVEFLLGVRQNLLERTPNKNLGYPLDYHIYDENYSKDFERAWELTKKIILETKRLTEENGGTYVLVILANNEQVNSGVWEEITKTYPEITKTEIDLEKPDKLLRKFCEVEKLFCHFLLPYFKDYVASNPDKKTHFRYDGHLNETGTNLLANFLTETLEGYFSIK
ncbi:MAG: SGNH/GDSL hydrolase family protein [Patescibacteria group bacterium]